MRYVNVDILILSSIEEIGALPKGIDIKTELNSDTWGVAADCVTLKQAFVDLFINECGNMTQNAILKISTSTMDLDDTLRQPIAFPAGPYIRITVAHGYQEGRDSVDEYQDFIEGTGEGLTPLQDVISSYHGFVEFKRQDNEDAALTIYLPAIERKPEAIYNIIASEAGAKNVLLVDDDAQIRDVTFQMLKRLGYGVMLASCGEEAIALYDPENIDLVVLDVIMPGMGGEEAFDRLRQMDPSATVLLVSGYSRSKTVEGILRRGAMGLLRKPFSLKELSTALRAILDEPH